MNKYPQENPVLAKRMSLISILISIVVLLLVGYMRQVKLDLGIDFGFIPPISAILNTLVAFCLIAAFYFIKIKNWIYHRNAIYGAMFFSSLFLIGYVLYHFTTIETTYCKEGFIRNIYYFFLITHIVLAGISLPFILLTFSKGFAFQVDKHKRMARWVFPVWLYVAITGPICYLMIKPCYI